MKYIRNFDMFLTEFCTTNTYGHYFRNHKIYVNLTSVPVLHYLLF